MPRKKIDRETKTLLALMSYVPFLCLVPLFTEREDDFVHFHAKQGFLIFVIEILGLLFFLALYLLFYGVPILRYLFFNFFFALFLLSALILMVVGMYFVLKKEKGEILWIGEISKNLKI